MIMRNHYTKQYIDLPIYVDYANLQFDICHETPFYAGFSEWNVAILPDGNRIYMPIGNNKQLNIYVVLKLYLDREIKYPHGIYEISFNDIVKNSFS